MKKIFFLLISCLITSSVGAQTDMDKLALSMQKITLTCDDISANCRQLFVKYYQTAPDSIPILLQYWESRCGFSEPLQRSKILYTISNQKYTDDVLSNKILNAVLNYQWVVEFSEKWKFIDTTDVDDAFFDDFTRQLANKNISKYDEGSIEYDWCKFYGTDYQSIFNNVRLKKYQNSKLTENYFDEVHRFQKMVEFHTAISLGVWVTTSDLFILGVHPEIGSQVGMKGRRLGLDASIGVRIFDVPQKYYGENTTKTSFNNDFWSFYLGLDAALIYLQKTKTPFQ